MAVVLFAPDRFGLSMTVPFAQVIAFRGALGLAHLTVGLVVLGAALLVRRQRRRRASTAGAATGSAASPPVGPSPAVALATALLLAGAGHLGVLASRGLVNDPPTTAPGTPTSEVTPGAVTVLAFNTYVGGAPAPDVARVAVAAGAEVIALPETPPEIAAEIAGLVAAAGTPMQVFSNDRGYSTVFTTSLLVSEALGVYEQVSTREGVGYVRVERVDAPGPTIASVHPSAPMPSTMDWWSRELVYAVDLCRDVPGAIVAGDFNATLDHAPMRDLGRCVDAASAAGPRGAGAFGTWPTSVHALLGAPIDRVLADGDAWAVTAAGVIQVGDSDHRGFVARLVPTTGG